MFSLSKVENKVIGATAGGGAGAALSTAALWALGVYAWHAPNTAAGNDAAIASVPQAVAALVPIFFAAVGALIGGYVLPPSNNAGHPLSKFASNAAPEPDEEGSAALATNVEVGDPDRGAVAADTDNWAAPGPADLN